MAVLRGVWAHTWRRRQKEAFYSVNAIEWGGGGGGGVKQIDLGGGLKKLVTQKITIFLEMVNFSKKSLNKIQTLLTQSLGNPLRVYSLSPASNGTAMSLC